MIIYRVTFPNNKIYIGQTIGKLSKRQSCHLTKAANGSQGAFHCALRKYQNLAIYWDIIDTAESKEELNQKEIYWIKFYNSIPESEGGWGYNLTLGGDSTQHTETSKRKLSLAKKGKRYLSDEHYRKLGERYKKERWFIKHTEETKRKLSLLQLGTKKTDQHKANISTGLGMGPIVAYKKDSLEFVGEFQSASDCARKLNLNVGHICSIIRGDTRLRSHKGLVFFRKGEAREH